VDIALLSMAMSQSQVQQQASMSVMKLAMGNADQQGGDLQALRSTTDVAMLQQATQPHLGGNIDVKL
jgi:hypothetical protein